MQRREEGRVEVTHLLLICEGGGDKGGEKVEA